jgi:hypothetical protein
MTISLCTAHPRAFPAIKNALWVTSLLVALPTVAFSASLSPWAIVVQALDAAAGELFFGTEIVENQLAAVAQCLVHLLHRIDA